MKVLAGAVWPEESKPAGESGVESVINLVETRPGWGWAVEAKSDRDLLW